MASKFFNSIKSAFVTEVEEQQEVQEAAKEESKAVSLSVCSDCRSDIDSGSR